MNYLAHGRFFTHDPYHMAGTAAPDWLGVIDRRMRLRSKTAQPHINDENPQLASFARGVMQHHADDGWFHTQPAFVDLSLQFTLRIRDLLAPDDGFRPSFVGHILVELLMDACLDVDDPSLLPKYYEALAALDPVIVQQYVNGLATRQTEILAPLIPRFHNERFLYDYKDDQRLLVRLNQVMKRVQLPPLPESFLQLLPSARSDVRVRLDELLPKEPLHFPP
ncbi:hypothetical protein [Anatilimnocola floriformis]|uniref:hypothetical protein n=1 Tax=Anatilimnocola floriformis TaxID=2948575 RepID=UPI0020C23066|nr:hypothetical protein [Anatilimnocola floriformis]